MRNLWLLITTALIIFACTEDNTSISDEGQQIRIIRDDRGEVSRFKQGDFGTGYTSDEEFFEYVLEKEENDSFELIDKGITSTGLIYTKYLQHYKGIPVWNGQYTIHKAGGYVYTAEGNYVRIGNININPALDEEAAILSWCKSLNTPVPEKFDVRVKLMIIQPGDNLSKPPVPAYRVYLRNSAGTNTRIGFLDAYNGAVLMTEPLFVF